MTRRIGILGGTFDPPHIAHLAMAETALEKIPLEIVLFMPAPLPPHKDAVELTPYPLRVRMVELAIQGRKGLELSLMEEFRDGPSYTVDLLRRFKSRSGDDLFLLIGADSLQEFCDWREPGEILRLATLVVFPRSGCSRVLPVGGDASVIFFEEPVPDVASTEIRTAFRAGRRPREELPDSVYQFILDKSLYT